FHIARTGRPGPVLVDIPKDVGLEEIDFVYPETVDLPGYKPTYKGHIRQILAAARLIAEAERPVLYVGGGAIHSGAHEEVRALAEKCDLPTTTTLMGLGAFPGDHPLFLGMLGMHGTVYANYAVNDCDLLIAAGARFDDRVTGRLDSFAQKAKVIHIDIDPAEIGKNVKADVPIVGDLRHVLSVLIDKVKPKTHEAWWEQIRQWQREYPLRYRPGEKGEIKPQYVVELVYELTRGDAIITTEVGQHQMWTAQYYKFRRPRQLLTSGGLGTMGYGFPAAIGAQLAHPDKLVIDIAGDGSFLMNIQELATAAEHNVPVKVVILNNRYRSEERSVGQGARW